MLARVLLLWLVLLNLATALWWWVQPASAVGAEAVAATATTPPGLTLLRELPPPPALPPCPEPQAPTGQAVGADAAVQAQAGVHAQRDCTPLR